MLMRYRMPQVDITFTLPERGEGENAVVSTLHDLTVMLLADKATG